MHWRTAVARANGTEALGCNRATMPVVASRLWQRRPREAEKNQLAAPKRRSRWQLRRWHWRWCLWRRRRVRRHPLLEAFWR